MTSKITGKTTTAVFGIILLLLIVQYQSIGLPEEPLLRAFFIVTFIIVLFAFGLSVFYIYGLKAQKWFNSLSKEKRREVRIKFVRAYGAWFAFYGLTIIYNDIWNKLDKLDFIGLILGIIFIGVGLACLLMPRKQFIRYVLGEKSDE